jgi:predicted ATPase/DNA-binding SARP family transcriptional activator
LPPLGEPLHEVEGRGNADVGLRIALLGSFRVVVHGHEIPAGAWRLQKARSIIKLLALTPELSLHRAQLIDWLWPEFEPVAAANNLHRTLHAARRALGSVKRPGMSSPTLRLHGQLVVLDPAGPLWIDVDAFQHAAREARVNNDANRYREAISLYTGELLPEDRYDDWAAGTREKLRQERLALLAGLADLLQAQGKQADALDVRAEIVREDPFDEIAQVALMRDLAQCGQRGKALAQYHELRSVLSEIDEAPSEESERLYRDILARRYPPSSVVTHVDDAPSSRNTNLPAPLTSFIGRKKERAELGSLLDPNRDDPRLVTLTGPGGSGKTRLALVVAADLATSFLNGVWFIDLSPLTDGDGLPGAIASALDIVEAPGHALNDVIADNLRDKTVLMIWDNCEHLVDACARLARFILARAPAVRILATSRQPLGMHGEAIWRVSPLEVPDPVPILNARSQRIHLDNLANNECVQLFHERARLVRSDFSLSPNNAAAVIQVCRRLDGMPLALELAAARMGTMSARSLAERLSRALHVLAMGGTEVSERQRTLRGTLDWSYNLLSESERALFRRLSVFAGGWTLEMAEGVCVDDQLAAPDVLGLLADLIDKSLVQFQADSGSGRYHLLEVVRQYAEECLVDSDEANEVRRRHADYCISLAETAEPALRGPDQADWLDRLEQEYSNIRSAIQWLTHQEDFDSALRLSGAIWWFCFLRGPFVEERVRLIRLLQEADAARLKIEPAVRAKALLAAGALAWKCEELPLARSLLEESVAIGRCLDDPAVAGRSLSFLGHVAGSQGDFEFGFVCAQEATERFRAAGDQIGLARSLNALGEDARRRGNDDQAEAYYRESLDIDRLVGNRAGMCLRLHNLGYVSLHRDLTENAAEQFFEGLELARELKDLDSLAACLEGVAAVDAVAGQAYRAMRLFGAADVLREELNVPIDTADLPEHERYIVRAESRLTDDLAREEWQAGRSMSLDEAISAATEAVQALTGGVEVAQLESSIDE